MFQAGMHILLSTLHAGMLVRRDDHTKMLYIR